MEKALQRLVTGPRHTGAVIGVGHVGQPGVRLHAAGDLGGDRPFYAASATKLLTTALVLQLAAEARLSLDTPFRTILSGDDSARLHVRGGHDLTDQITLRQLLQHCSGLPDYFQSATPTTGLLAEISQGRDRGWSFAEAMEIARRLGPVGAPGDLRRAHYSDTNFQILGQVVETLAGMRFAEAVRLRLCVPLDLTQTWIFSDSADRRPAPLRHGVAALDIPCAMASFQADGGLVTTAREGVQLLQGLFDGRLMPKGWWEPLCDWRPVFPPLRYGTGLMRFSLPRWMTGFRAMPEWIGHSGLSGALLFHAPQTGMVVAGTVNQIERPGTSFRLLVKLGLGR